VSHVDTVRRVYDEWARGNYRAGLELYDPEMTLEVHSPIPDAAVFEGLDGLQRYLRQFLETWHDYDIRGIEYAEHGTAVVVKVHHQGTASGAVVGNHFYTAWTFDGDRVVRMDHAYDAATALAGASQVG
jgi:ketosteroid isomerase-like protein